MKKTVLIIMIMMLIAIGLSACTKKETPDPSLADVLDSYFQLENDYSVKDCTFDFSKEEVEECMQNEKNSEFFDLILSYQEKYSMDDISDKETFSVNMFLMFDYVFRPAFLGDQASFEDRLPLILNDRFLYHSYSYSPEGACDVSYIKFYVQNMRSNEFDLSVADIVVPVIDKLCPPLPDADSENLHGYCIWCQHRFLASVILKNADPEAGAQRDYEDTSTGEAWIEQAFEKLKR